MTNYRRSQKGLTYFFTVVTHKRRAFLTDKLARECLRKVWKDVETRYPFQVIALCLLPEHLHCIWRLPTDDKNYSRRWGLIKKNFSKLYLASGGHELKQSYSRVKKRESGIWQRRFYEHRIRDHDDLRNHANYIHYNPVKHGHVKKVTDWPWSTYHKYYRKGYYKDFDWDVIDKLEMDRDIEYEIEYSSEYPEM